MTERTESLLAELVEVQRQMLANQRQALEEQRVALEMQRAALLRHRRAVRIGVPVVILIGLAVLLPYAWRWVVFLLAR